MKTIFWNVRWRKEVLIIGVALLGPGFGCSHAPKQPDGGVVAQGAPQLAVVNWDGSAGTQEPSRARPVVGTRGIVSSDDRVASEWGAEILRGGGNALDAAVATTFVLAVTRPYFASLGGGGFLVYCPKSVGGVRSRCEALDFREQAPAAATKDMYIRDGKARPDLLQDGALAVGVPGVPSGLLTALAKWGTRPRAALLARPIQLARHGFPFTGWLERAAVDRWDAFNPEARKLFGRNGRARVPGERVVQRDLARVLEAIAARGADGFYRGWVARGIAQGLRAAGGILTEEDLSAYRPVFRTPVMGVYRGMEVVSMPPPSSGGTLLLQQLGYAERAARAGELSDGPGAARSVHALAHGMGLSFADRARHFGDPDFYPVPVRALLDGAYLDSRWSTFRRNRAVLLESPGVKGEQVRPAHNEGLHTTHLSVVDAEGNAAALTLTVNAEFGSGFVPPGTGIVMNDEMDDFSIQPGVPNQFGLVGDEANAIAPKKRPLSSMSPTIVRDQNGEVRIVLGAEGGPRIITSVALTLINRLEWGMSLADAVAYPRFHEQWKPPFLGLESFGFPAETRTRLSALGYAFGDGGRAVVHAIERFANGRTWGVADPRGEGASVAVESAE